MEFKIINVDIETEIWYKVGVFAAENSTTKKDVVNAALSEYLEKKEKGDAKRVVENS